jgi:hypothetical protein
MWFVFLCVLGEVGERYDLCVVRGGNATVGGMSPLWRRYTDRGGRKDREQWGGIGTPPRVTVSRLVLFVTKQLCHLEREIFVNGVPYPQQTLYSCWSVRPMFLI